MGAYLTVSHNLLPVLIALGVVHRVFLAMGMEESVWMSGYDENRGCFIGAYDITRTQLD